MRFGVLTTNHFTFSAKILNATLTTAILTTATLTTATLTTTMRKGLLSHESRRLSGKSIR
ncbi:hypothetical protein F2Q69_00044097 [Brassica cretica]|uniref:Uncharacterized protein n=1 Tax=Brassica cretica TaxID=69181 RepID=A0A8S9N8H8_BRACR|nr:hypothetical protein F2Q69_00044097 [Brassica cretica]